MLKDLSPRPRGARGSHLAAMALSPMILSILLAACGLSTEGELYEETSGGGTSPSTSSGQGPTGSGGSSSSSSQGAGGNGTGGVGGMGGVGGAPPPEDCFDGLDNDKDTLVDCADTTDCGPTVECVPAIPTGWAEYVRIVIEPHTGQVLTPPPCPTPAVGYFSGPAGAPTCAGCNCKWMDAACSAPKIECFLGTLTCGGSVDAMYTSMDENCISLSMWSQSNSDESCRIASGPVVVNKGTCNPGGGGVIPSPGWQDEVFTCPVIALKDAGCDNGQTCAPKASADFSGSLCIRADGAQSCPAGWNASELVVYAGGNDTRACSACTCNDDLSCNNDGYYTAHDDNGCGGQGVMVNGGCTGAVTNNLGFEGSLKPKLASVKEGTCGGNVPSGAMEPTGAVTICCR